MAFKGEYICDVHKDIIKKANEIMKLKSKNFDTIDDALWETNSLADDIYNYSEKCLTLGQSMENCIKERREAIESAIKELESGNYNVQDIVEDSREAL